MNVLVIGSGGREHALAWKLAQSNRVHTVFCCPGNGGTSGENIQRINITDYSELATYCLNHDVGLVVVGPEKPLCEGLVDLFRRHGLTVFGPTKEAAKLEGSKWYAKEFMQRYGIPTARASLFSNKKAAIEHIKDQTYPIVVKADGLAAGKGVTVAPNEETAIDAVERCFSGVFGESGRKVVVEEYLDGEEASILAFIDNHSIIPLASSQDHKRLNDGDLGPNTGGMGAYSPAPIVNESVWKQVNEEILSPFLKGCQHQDLDYRGLIYAGIMITVNGPKVLEFNVRFGDPETQAVLARLESDLAAAMLATVENNLSQFEFIWSNESAVCVVLASQGYPGKYETGFVIDGIDQAEIVGTKVFHAGTEWNGSNYVTAGGRVLGVIGHGKSIKNAVKMTYSGVDKISWPAMSLRRDIGKKAINAS